MSDLDGLPDFVLLDPELQGGTYVIFQAWLTMGSDRSADGDQLLEVCIHKVLFGEYPFNEEE